MATIFVKSDIRKVVLALEKSYYHEVCLELGKAGFVHIIHSSQDSSDENMQEKIRDEQIKSAEILSKIESSLASLNVLPVNAGASGELHDTEKDLSYVSRVKGTIDRVMRLRSRIEEELQPMSMQRPQMTQLGPFLQSCPQSKTIQMFFWCQAILFRPLRSGSLQEP